MRGTPTPLSVAFIDAAGTVLQIEDMEPETEVMHWSTLPAREGLEMEIGNFQRLGIAPGSRLIRREYSSKSQSSHRAIFRCHTGWGYRHRLRTPLMG
ncbi:DUF192 domain-containing protein [Pseudomonas fluorescens]|uniref:DUF192 domain-containing protein n=1 Tax=Pseudomonas fluorescens TaxID=294 RepID=A0A5E7CSW6_PSEFL|nr:hypothetical protein PS710_03222 [Pseudomonas fluorescens]